MSTKLIYVPQSLKPAQQHALAKLAPAYTFRFKADTLSQQEYAQVEMILGWNNDVCPKILHEPNSQLKWIQTSSAGVDFLDLNTIRTKGILLSNGSGIHGIPIAESVLGMLLARARVIQPAIRAQSQKQWLQRPDYDELFGKKMLIVGTGEIGQRLAQVGQALGLHVAGVSRRGRPLAHFEHVYKQQECLPHVANYDIIVNILPLTAATTYFYDETFFNQTKPGCYFINVGRGQSVKTTALIAALTSGQVGFAGLDVFEAEPLAPTSPLWEMENVLITPHTAGLARDFTTRLMDIFQRNLTSYLATGQLDHNQIDLTTGY